MRSSWERAQGFFPHLVLLSGLAISLTQFSDQLGPSMATVIKISNFLKFLLPPYSCPFCHTRAFCQGVWFFHNLCYGLCNLYFPVFYAGCWHLFYVSVAVILSAQFLRANFGGFQKCKIAWSIQGTRACILLFDNVVPPVRKVFQSWLPIALTWRTENPSPESLNHFS